MSLWRGCLNYWRTFSGMPDCGRAMSLLTMPHEDNEAEMAIIRDQMAVIDLLEEDFALVRERDLMIKDCGDRRSAGAMAHSEGEGDG